MKIMWLGFIFIVAVFLLVAGILLVERITLFASPATLVVEFEVVNRLRVGDDVLVDGIIYGKVSGVDLTDTGVRVTCTLNQDLKLYPGYEIKVESFSILGGNQISIRRGNPGLGEVPKQAVYRGEARPAALDAMGDVIDENRASLKGAMDNLRETLEKINTGQGSLGRLVNDPSLFENIDSITGKMDRGEGTVGKLLNDETLYNDLTGITGQIRTGPGLVHRLLYDDQLSSDLAATASNLKDMTTDLKEVIHTVREGKGTIGKLFKDMEAEGKEDLYDSTLSAMESMDKTLGRVSRSIAWLGLDSRTYTDSDVSIGKVFVRFEPDATKYFQAGGAFMTFDESSDEVVFERQVEEDKNQTFIKPEFYIAYKIPWFASNKLRFKAGLMEGLPGGAVEFDNDDWGFFEYPIQLTLEARDSYNDLDHDDIDENINGPMVRLYAKASLYPEGEGWFGDVLHATKAYVGFSRMGDSPELVVGIGLEFIEEDIRTLIGLAGVGP